ncbi:MAG: hypothetical protein IJK23_11060 [Clostridia bacterium]|nr:hypothetical protein [Clostridia bacterium]
MNAFLSALLSLFISVFCFFVRPAVVFDASDLTGEVMGGASGFLYGIAEEGVPSADMTDSLRITSVSAKTADGLQHPIGDVAHIASQLLSGGAAEYIVVYLQDTYATWYYDDAAITEMKKIGEYDYLDYLETVYFPQIRETVEKMKNTPYADKLVYCLYNECDNGVWFGEWNDDGNGGGWNGFGDEGRQTFYDAWKRTYDYVKTLDPDARFGGPGYMEYSAEKLDGFFAYCTENACMPDALIYHELQDRSVYDWQAHVRELHGIEAKYGIPETLPVIVTEYGRMQDNGDPCEMTKYIVQCETTKVYAEQAYWLLSNNLSNTCADYNTPNSAWWAYRWYASMRGQTMNYKICDPTHADMGKAIKENRELRYQEFMAVGSLTDEKDRIEILAAGADYDGKIKIKGLKSTALYGEQVKITVERAAYQGLAGEVFAPEIITTYTQKCGASVSVPLKGMNGESTYHITVEPAEQSETKFINEDLYTRYEFEHGTLLGAAYTYDSAYATTGETEGMVGGMENEGDGVELKIKVPADGEYELRIVYGKAADGLRAEERRDAKVHFSLNGDGRVLSLPNTVRSEYTAALTLTERLTQGENTLRFTHGDGTYVLDSLLVRRAQTPDNIYFETVPDGNGRTLAVAPHDGYYVLNGEKDVFLKRGVNFVGEAISSLSVSEKEPPKVVTAAEMTLTGSAKLVTDDGETAYIDGISSAGGTLSFPVTAETAGKYNIVLCYASGRENGAHAYNIDLVEDFVTVCVNGEKQKNVYCRNTCSFYAYTTVAFTVDLPAGESVISLSNDGALTFNGGDTFAPRIAWVKKF